MYGNDEAPICSGSYAIVAVLLREDVLSEAALKHSESGSFAPKVQSEVQLTSSSLRRNTTSPQNRNMNLNIVQTAHKTHHRHASHRSHGILASSVHSIGRCSASQWPVQPDGISCNFSVAANESGHDGRRLSVSHTIG